MTRIPVIWWPVLFLIAGYIVLNRGFAYIGQYPVYIGEITLLIYIFIIRNFFLLGRFYYSVYGKLIIFLILGFLIFFFDGYRLHGSDALRDSVFWVYICFSYLGFSFARYLVRAHALSSFDSFLTFVFLLVVVYLLLFPAKDLLLQKTDFLERGNSLLGYYSTYHAISVAAGFFLILRGEDAHSSILKTLGWLAIALTVFVTQSRASMLVTIACFIVYGLRRGSLEKVLGLLARGAILVAVGLGGLLLFHVSLQGERGAVSFDSVIDLFFSIFGVDDSSLAERAAGSSTDRLLWWQSVISTGLNDMWTFLFGQGIGQIFVDRVTLEGYMIRYPHNSFVSVFGWTGIVGFLMYIAVYFFPLYGVKLEKQSTFQVWYPIFVAGFSIGAFFSTVFEAPFHSAVFWFLSGVMVGSVHFSQLHARSAAQRKAIR